MKADEIRRDTRPWEFWLKECAYQLALANERGTAEPEAPMTCRSCNASTRDFKPYPCCGRCGAMLLRDAVPEPQAEPFGDNEQSRFIAGMKGAAARAGGFPKETPHGYAGRNAKAFIDGWEYCNGCLRDPNFKPPQPPDASAGECAGADVVTDAGFTSQSFTVEMAQAIDNAEKHGFVRVVTEMRITAANVDQVVLSNAAMTAALRTAFAWIRETVVNVAFNLPWPHAISEVDYVHRVLDEVARRLGIKP